jgi:hypothetical protein
MTILKIKKEDEGVIDPYEVWIDKMKEEVEMYYKREIERIIKKEKIKYCQQRFKAKKLVEDIVRQIVG